MYTHAHTTSSVAIFHFMALLPELHKSSFAWVSSNGLARSCMNMLERRIWKSSIRLETKLCRYQTYIVPVLIYGCETWATTKYLLSRIDAFDTWALRMILRIPYTRHVSNAEVRRTTDCSPLSHLVTNRRLWLFGHIARSSPRKDHHRAIAACIRQVPPDWKRPAGRPRKLGSVQLRQILAL